jgi:hypothetical protein
VHAQIPLRARFGFSGSVLPRGLMTFWTGLHASILTQKLIHSPLLRAFTRSESHGNGSHHSVRMNGEMVWYEMWCNRIMVRSLIRLQKDKFTTRVYDKHVSADRPVAEAGANFAFQIEP